MDRDNFSALKNKKWRKFYEIKKNAAAMLAATVLAAAVPIADTLSYAEIIANAGGGESDAENAQKLIVDGKEIVPDSTYLSTSYYSIKGNAAHTYYDEDGFADEYSLGSQAGN